MFVTYLTRRFKFQSSFTNLRILGLIPNKNAAMNDLLVIYPQKNITRLNQTESLMQDSYEDFKDI